MKNWVKCVDVVEVFLFVVAVVVVTVVVLVFQVICVVLFFFFFFWKNEELGETCWLSAPISPFLFIYSSQVTCGLLFFSPPSE